MKNREKFAKEIVDIVLGVEDIAVDKCTMIPVKCGSLECDRCIRDCGGICDDDKLLEWAEAEYKEPRIDPRLYNAPVDTKILVSLEGKSWFRRYFSNVNNDCVYAFNDGMTSFTAEKSEDVSGWHYAKLYEGDKES